MEEGKDSKSASLLEEIEEGNRKISTPVVQEDRDINSMQASQLSVNLKESGMIARSASQLSVNLKESGMVARSASQSEDIGLGRSKLSQSLTTDRKSQKVSPASLGNDSKTASLSSLNKRKVSKTIIVPTGPDQIRRSRLKRQESIFAVRSAEQSRLRLRNDASVAASCTFSDTPSRLNENVTPQQRRKSLAQQNIKYQNTYKLEPDKRFLTHKVEHLMEQVVLDHLEDTEYSESLGRKMVKRISDKILHAVEKLQYHRYKLVVVVNIGQMFRQTVRAASRCLWQTATDNYAEVVFESNSLWCTAVVYGVYYE